MAFHLSLLSFATKHHARTAIKCDRDNVTSINQSAQISEGVKSPQHTDSENDDEEKEMWYLAVFVV